MFFCLPLFLASSLSLSVFFKTIMKNVHHSVSSQLAYYESLLCLLTILHVYLAAVRPGPTQTRHDAPSLLIHADSQSKALQRFSVKRHVSAVPFVTSVYCKRTDLLHRPCCRSALAARGQLSPPLGMKCSFFYVNCMILAPAIGRISKKKKSWNGSLPDCRSYPLPTGCSPREKTYAKTWPNDAKPPVNWSAACITLFCPISTVP